MKNTPRNALICLALSLITPPAAMAETPAQDCPTLNARYTMEGADGFELRFEMSNEPNLFSDLHVVVTTPKYRYVMELLTGTGITPTYIVLPGNSNMPDDRDRFPLYGFDANYKVIEEVPQSDTPAAQYYFTPDIVGFFYYDQPVREYLPRELWHLAGCN